MNFWDYFQAIVIIAAVLFAAYYVTKLVAKTGGGFRKSSGIKLIGSQTLGKDKSVSIVEIGEYIYILGVGTQRVEMLDKFLSSEFCLKKEEPAAVMPTFGESFREELNKRFNRSRKDD